MGLPPKVLRSRPTGVSTSRYIRPMTIGEMKWPDNTLGLDTVTIAGSYHAGKFLRPHGRNGKVYFPEDGTTYFRTDGSRYGAIKPFPNSLLA